MPGREPRPPVGDAGIRPFFALAAVLLAVLALGFIVGHAYLSRLAGAALIGWAIWHAVYGHRRKVRFGMQAGLFGLLIWSFLMASAHGAGLMLVPVIIPLCLASGSAGELTAAGSLAVSLAAIGVHMAAMLGLTAAIAIGVYEWIGLAFLRRGWINLDLIWTIALVLTGLILLLT